MVRLNYVRWGELACCRDTYFRWFREDGFLNHAIWLECKCLFLLPDRESKQVNTGPEMEPPASSSLIPAKHSSTIFIQTLQFLLKNSALQVRMAAVLHSQWTDVCWRWCSFSCCQMAEQALSQELQCSGDQSISYIFHLAQCQLLRADYCQAAANLKEVLCKNSQVSIAEADSLTCSTLLVHSRKVSHITTSELSLVCDIFTKMLQILIFWNRILRVVLIFGHWTVTVTICKRRSTKLSWATKGAWTLGSSLQMLTLSSSVWALSTLTRRRSDNDKSWCFF